jgi:hypothetical protein
LWCNGLVDPTELQLEALGDEGRAARAYVGPDAPAPSVVTLNGLAASLGTTDFLLATMGLYEGSLAEHGPGYVRTRVRAGIQYLDHPRRDVHCPYCGDNDSLMSLGDAARIPTVRGEGTPNIS